MSKRPPIRTTGFTRFFIVMLFVAPLAYVGASYYNGEDGIKNIKKLLRLEKATTVSTPAEEPVQEAETVRVNEAPSNQKLKDENLRIKEELEFKKKRIEELYRENEELKRKLESAEKALEESKK